MINEMRKYLYSIGDLFEASIQVFTENANAFLMIFGLNLLLTIGGVVIGAVFLAMGGGAFMNNSILSGFMFFVVAGIIMIGAAILSGAVKSIGSDYILMNSTTGKAVDNKYIFPFVKAKFKRYLGILMVQAIVAVVIMIVVGGISIFLGAGVIVAGFEGDLEATTNILGGLFVIAYFIAGIFLIKYTFAQQSLAFFDTGIVESFAKSSEIISGYVIHVIKNIIILAIITGIFSTMVNKINEFNWIFSIIGSLITTIVGVVSSLYRSLLFLNLNYYNDEMDFDDDDYYGDYDDDYNDEYYDVGTSEMNSQNIVKNRLNEDINRERELNSFDDEFPPLNKLSRDSYEEPKNEEVFSLGGQEPIVKPKEEESSQFNDDIFSGNDMFKSQDNMFQDDFNNDDDFDDLF